jgi:hypothetical protein
VLKQARNLRIHGNINIGSENMHRRKKETKKTIAEEPETIVATQEIGEETIVEFAEEEIVETKPDATLEDMILHIYKNAEPGPITISRLLGETGLASKYDSKTGTLILSEAWGKLALQGKVSKTQFLKEK